MSTYEINSFRGALSDEEDKGIRGAFKFGRNLDIRKRVDSLSCGQALLEEGIIYGRSVSPSASTSPSSSVSSSVSPSPSNSASPSVGESASPSTTASTSVSRSPSSTPSFSLSPSPSPSFADNSWYMVFKDLIKVFVKSSDGFTYGFGNTGYVYRRDNDGFWIRIYKDPDGEIKGAEEKPSANGALWLYFATDKKLKRKPLPGRSDWNDVETVDSNLDSSDWHTMRQVGGGLHIANRQKLALVGYDDSYTSEAVNLIPGNIAKTIVERDGRAIIGTVRASNPNVGINAAIDTEVPLAQIGSEGDIYFANMADSMPVKSFPGGGKVNPGGVANQVEQANFFEWEENALSWVDKQSVGNMALFAVYGADTGTNGIYSYGRKRKNMPFVLNLDHHINIDGASDQLGALTYVDGKVLVSYFYGTTFGVEATDPNNKAEATYESLDLYAPKKKLTEITTWKTLELSMAPLPSGCWIQAYYKVNKTGSWTLAYTADDATSFTTTNAQKAVFRIGAEGRVFEFKLVLHPNANATPEVYAPIRIHFE